MRIVSRHWGESGVRTWKSARLFLFKAGREDFQGDVLYTVTVHLLRRAFQLSIWRWIGLRRK